MSSTHTDKDSCRFRWTLSHSQVGTFPSLVSKVRLPVFFPEAVLPKDDCTSVAQEEQLVLRLNPNFLACDWEWCPSLWEFSIAYTLSHLGASDKCTCVDADTASLASPAIPRSLEIVSKNLSVPI